MALSTASLYEEDFYAWTQQQAELLRRLPVVGNEIELEHIAEESSNIPGSTSPRTIGGTKSSNGASS
jgi:hypothetical protein